MYDIRRSGKVFQVAEYNGYDIREQETPLEVGHVAEYDNSYPLYMQTWEKNFPTKLKSLSQKLIDATERNDRAKLHKLFADPNMKNANVVIIQIARMLDPVIMREYLSVVPKEKIVSANNGLDYAKAYCLLIEPLIRENIFDKALIPENIKRRLDVAELLTKVDSQFLMLNIPYNVPHYAFIILKSADLAKDLPSLRK